MYYAKLPVNMTFIFWSHEDFLALQVCKQTLITYIIFQDHTVCIKEAKAFTLKEFGAPRGKSPLSVSLQCFACGSLSLVLVLLGMFVLRRMLGLTVITAGMKSSLHLSTYFLGHFKTSPQLLLVFLADYCCSSVLMGSARKVLRIKKLYHKHKSEWMMTELLIDK